MNKKLPDRRIKPLDPPRSSWRISPQSWAAYLPAVAAFQRASNVGERQVSMVRKLKSSTARRKPTKKRPPYPSLAERPSPAERLAQLLKEAEERGIKPLTAEDLDAMGNVWPEDKKHRRLSRVAARVSQARTKIAYAQRCRRY